MDRMRTFRWTEDDILTLKSSLIECMTIELAIKSHFQDDYHYTHVETKAKILS